MARHDVPKHYLEWENAVLGVVRKNPLWKTIAYRKALFVYDLVWEDCDTLMKDMRGQAIARQIIRSAGSISANMEEGFGHGLGRDYARILGIALGEARETQGWYFRARRLLPATVIEHRLALLDEVIALLVTIIDQQRKRK
ncbi:MAG: four helix bundle protein [Chloroflexi bacterium]|nr:four helix bundle protein [Chloroflexota bacterium]